jgi:translation initiation factor IF-1
VVKQEKELTEGLVTELLPNAMFRIERADTGEEVIGFLSGKMRKFRIKVLVGDTVLMVIDPYGGKVRIERRQ